MTERTQPSTTDTPPVDAKTGVADQSTSPPNTTPSGQGVVDTTGLQPHGGKGPHS